MLVFSNSKYLFENCVNTVVAYMEMGAEIPEDYAVVEPDVVDVNGDEIDTLEHGSDELLEMDVEDDEIEGDLDE